MVIATHAQGTDHEVGSLRHVMVVGGTFAEWSRATTEEWEARVDALGAWCDHTGVRWLTIRTYERGERTSAPFPLWHRAVDGCVVVVDPTEDGRARFAAAMNRLDPSEQVNEASVAAVLYEPADCEPDLVVIVGPPTRLPPSLVWELAYAELVFVDSPWSEFCVAHLAAAVDDFAHRRRRFGGLDDDDEYAVDG